MNFSIVLYDSCCSNDCVFCHSKELGDIERNIKKELEKIDKELRVKKIIDRIEISGHDPGEYDNLPNFVRLVKAKSGASKISLFTHGKKLSERNYLKRLIKSGVNHYVIPLYGHKPMIHDSVTKSSGSFLKTMEGIRNIHYYGQKVSFQCLITRENQSHLDEFFKFLSELSFSDFCRVGIPYYKNEDEKFRKSLPDFTKLKNQLSEALKVAMVAGFNVQLFDIPKCLINFDYKNISSNSIPRKAYENMKDKKENSYSILKNEVIPDYRTKIKGRACTKCIHSGKCEGIYKTYIDSKLFKFNPVLKN